MTENEKKIEEAKNKPINFDEPDDKHVVPALETHIASSSCRCEPFLDRIEEDGRRVYVHRMMQ